jgi:hypothetical protein
MAIDHVDFSIDNATQRTCLNGHVISNHAADDPAQPYCDDCGAKTIDRCPACNGLLRGESNYRPTSPDPKPEKHCLHCGKAFPWTEAHIQAVLDIARYIDSLNEEDRLTLARILPDLVSEKGTPRTPTAIVHMRALLKKGGTLFAEAVQKSLETITSEAIRRATFGS